MNAGLTYRDRALAAEARVAELEDELAAWREADKGEQVDAASSIRIAHVRRRVREITGFADGRAVAKTLLLFLGSPGRLITRAAIFRELASSEYTDPKIIDVRVSRLRAVLRAIGFPAAITTVWGEGYVMAPEAVGPIRLALGISEQGRAA